MYLRMRIRIEAKYINFITIFTIYVTLLAHPNTSDSRNDRVRFSDCTLNSVGINQMGSIIRKGCSTCIHFILNRVDNFLEKSLKIRMVASG